MNILDTNLKEYLRNFLFITDRINLNIATAEYKILGIASIEDVRKHKNWSDENFFLGQRDTRAE